MKLAGRWRIVEMELWDEDAIDLVGPAYIELRDDDQGSFRFIAVEGWMDVRSVERDGRPGIEFSWEGNDEMDPASGRGWATVGSDGSLEVGSSSPWGRFVVSSRAGVEPLTVLSTFWTSLDVCRTS